LRGHAIECRVYAEDPGQNFLPSPGKIQKLTLPSGPGVRNDSGIFEGWTVPLEYDPLLAKLITYAPTRAQAANSSSVFFTSSAQWRGSPTSPGKSRQRRPSCSTSRLVSSASLCSFR